ncbi:MAG TPA: PQQ-binding-like beta-propeller repeat protein [Gemmataceae bacterium]|jgi:outer membrane protein assembly factor BamB|nr:PQQ-binding-like beta-propeller repeat protein [Gemmataceae bacterium]
MKTSLSLCALLILLSTSHAENWPGWRGANGLGQSTAKDLPLTWGPTEHIRWKTPLPDTGNASPVVWGDNIFLTQATNKGTKRGILCIDRATGKVKWGTYIDFAGAEPTHDTNPFGSATCVTDGERVITSLGSAGLFCVDFNGKELWRKDLGEFIHIWGNASSPVLHGDHVILWCGPGERQFLIALNKKTGDEVWRHEEAGGDSGLKKGDKWIGSWSTPVIAKIGDREELLLSVPKSMKSFDPKTGKELWHCDGLTELVYTSPVLAPDGTVIAMSGYGGSALAVKAGGTGDMTKERLWHHPRNPQRIGSAVVVGDHAYLVNEPGLASCFELKTGKDLWKQERLMGSTWGSLVRAGDRMYVTSRDGETVVLKADPAKMDVLARNKLPDTVLASIAIADGELLIRGYKFLWCVSAKK